jgi:HK97 gp10 family phage protein
VIRVDASELAALAADMAGGPARLLRLGLSETERSAEAMAQTGRQLAPVETGLLRSSITADINDLQAEVGPTVYYAVFVEYGTSRMAPQPFMGPAGDMHEADYADSLADGAEDAVFG